MGDGGVGEEDCGVDEGFHGCFPRCIGVGWGWLGSWLGLVWLVFVFLVRLRLCFALVRVSLQACSRYLKALKASQFFVVERQ